VGALALCVLLQVIFATTIAGASPDAKAPPGKVMPLIRPADGMESPSGAAHALPRILRYPSQKNLLGLERDNEFGLPKTSLQAERVLKMLAIRVEFVAEDPDDPSTTGNGTFDMRDSGAFHTEHGHLFDAAPHDSAYFGKHIEALSRYWHTVSNGKVSIVGTVYPPGSQPAYKLPHMMAHYGEQPPEYGLTQFYFDAFRAADTTNPEIDFGDYDVFCVFHAGADRQNDWMWNTPNDLFTGFIRLGAPIPVDHGLHFITEGLITPETVSQDNRIVVLNAVMAHEFGHQLGLVDLYCTETFITQVGNFSLMDNNVANVGGEIEVDGRTRLLFGSLPVYPDAWSRAFLDMIEIDTVRANPDAYVYAAELDNEAPQAVLVPITRGEYYLIENRRVNIDADPITAILADSATNVILGPVDSDRNFSREYDYLLPGNGILIWHVDELVAFEDRFPDDDIPNNFLANTLQCEFKKRFLSLVEADMIVSFRGTEYDNFGTYTDMFSAPERRDFSPDTPIPTTTNSGARTGITITVKSPAALVMVFSVDNDQTLPGFPVWCGAGPQYFSPSIIDIDNDTSPEIIVGSGNRIFGWRFDGTPIYNNGIIDTIISLNGDLVPQRAAVMAEMSQPLLGPPWVSFIDGVGHVNVAATDQNNTIYFWRLTDFDPPYNYADLVFAGVAEHALAGPAIIFDRPGSLIREMVFALDDGGLMTLTGNGKDSTFNFSTGRVMALAGTSVEMVIWTAIARWISSVPLRTVRFGLLIRCYFRSWVFPSNWRGQSIPTRCSEISIVTDIWR
jgi:M6 family metalloprotease-like protein